MKKKDYRKKAREIDDITSKIENAWIQAKTPFLPCEDLDKVRQALTNVVNGEISIEEYGDEKYLVVYNENPNTIYRIFHHFRNRRVLATLRKYLNRYSSENEIIMYLHKQAAYKGVLSLSEPGESPGGEIIVIIKIENAKEVIRHLTKF